MMTKTYKQLAAIAAVVLLVIGTTVPRLEAATGTLAPAPYLTVLDSSGNPLSGACVWTYVAGTSTPVATYTDKTVTVANSNPIIADSAGQVVAYLIPGQSYKFTFETACTPPAHGSVLRTQDGIDAVPSSSSALDVTGTAGETITAGQCAYLSDGSGAKVAGQWYKCDSANGYSSTLGEVGIVPSTINGGTSGAIRLAGAVPGLSGLAVGSEYFVGSAGAITATAPALRRHLGHADSSTSLILTADPASLVQQQPLLNDFRLSLTTATCITTADVTAAGTLFWTPCTGNRMSVFSTAGVSETCAAAELSIAVPAAVSQMYDVWVYDTSFGACTLSLELLAWTNDTTRATGISRSSGRYTKTGDTSRMYVGSVRSTTVANQTEDSVTKRYVWNMYNRVPRQLLRNESTGSWNYTIATWRQANASTANQVEAVIGVSESPIWITLNVLGLNSAGGGIPVTIGIGEDSTTAAVSAASVGVGFVFTAGDNKNISATLQKVPAVGYHKYVWLEASTATGTTTFFGAVNATAGDTGARGSGLNGWVQ